MTYDLMLRFNAPIRLCVACEVFFRDDGNGVVDEYAGDLTLITYSTGVSMLVWTSIGNYRTGTSRSMLMRPPCPLEGLVESGICPQEEAK